jgi:hypothetical protein
MIRSLALVALLAATGGNAENKTFAPPSGPVTEVVAMLKSAAPTATADELRTSARACAELLAPQSPAAEALAKLGAGAESAAELRSKFAEIVEALTFQPLREAELPAGFPTYTPPGIIELKTYPVHRRAVAKQFYTLFAHITRNEIAMTAPVRMEFDQADDGQLTQESMAFFYGDPETGRVGVDESDKNVETIEDQGQTVIALGNRGRWHREAIAAGERRLRKWIEANPEYEATGDLIVMGYNSPMTPAARQFFEIQLPVEKKAGKGE